MSTLIENYFIGYLCTICKNINQKVTVVWLFFLLKILFKLNIYIKKIELVESNINNPTVYYYNLNLVFKGSGFDFFN